MHRDNPKIFVIGSCRVHRPLASMDGQGAHYLTGGLGAYTHTAKESIQRLQQLRGSGSIPARLAPFVYSTNTPPPWTPRMSQELHDCDVLVVEISSEKEVLVDSVCLQLNYVASGLIGPLGIAGKEWWSQLLRTGVVSDAAIAMALEQCDALGLEDGARDVVLHARLFRSDSQSLRADLHALAQLAAKPVLIVTHVNLNETDASMLRGRAQFIARLKDACKDVPGMFVFDPTSVVNAFGTTFALGDGGADVNHYAESFEPILGRLLVAHVCSLLTMREGSHVSETTV